MTTKDYIKVHNPATEVAVHDSENLITLDPGVSVTLEFTDTEKYTDEEIKNIQWIANMFHGRPQNSTFHKTLKGPKAKFRVPTVYSGGGLGWVEPVIPGHDPQFKSPFGYFINSIGERKIDKVEWRDTHGNEISGSKFFTEAVQLHIYTTGLYGHEIQVTLYDKDTISKNDRLELDENVHDNDTSNLARYFNREVKVLQDADDNTSKVQKVIIDIRLEKRWAETEESEIELIAEVLCKIDGGVKKLFDQNVLIVKTPEKGEENKVNNATKSGNKPTIIGDIVTDVAEFKPCFYTKITGEVMRGEEKIQDVVIYEQGQTDPSQTTLTFPVVAGTQYSKAQIKLKLDSDTGDCLLTNVHTDRVIDLSKIPEAVVVESRTPAKKIRILDSGDILSGGTVKTRDSADENDGDNKGAHGSNSLLNGFAGYKSLKPKEVPETKYRKEAKSDTEVEIDLVYNFSKARNNQNLLEIVLANLWPIHKKAPIIYPVLLGSCRKDLRINIAVYPDIKWILQFGFNYDRTKFQQMLTEEHKKYETKLQELEEAYEKETVSERQRERELEEFKKRAERRRDKLGDKIANSPEGSERTIQLWDAHRKAESDIQRWDKKIENNRKKYKEEREQLKQDKEQARKNKRNKVKDNLEPDDALEDGLANIQLSLVAEWDRPYKGIDITESFEKAKQFVGLLVRMEKDLRLLVKGKNEKVKPEKEDQSRFNQLKDFVKSLDRPLYTFEIIPPSLGAALIWYAEHPKSGKESNEPAMGIMGEGKIIADPLVGFEFNFDIIALVAKAHPIARGIVMVMDLLAKLGSDESEIRLDFNVEGKLNLEAKGAINTASGKTNFSQSFLAKDEDDSPAALSGEIEIKLVANLKLTTESEHWLFSSVKVKAGVDAGAKLITGITAEGKVKADDEGIYVEPTVLFHGIKVALHVTAFAKLVNDEDEDDDADPLIDLESKPYEETFVLMNAYEWGADSIGLKKWYIT